MSERRERDQEVASATLVDGMGQEQEQDRVQ